MTYNGWVPVASGFLSFTNIKGQIIAGRCSAVPDIDGSLDSFGKECVIRSSRTLIDRPFGPMRSFFGSKDEQYEFECRAQRIQDGASECLVGTVIAHPRIEIKEAEILKQEKSIKPGVYKNCLAWVIGFRLERNGFITLDWGDLKPGHISQIFDTDSGLPELEAEKLLTFETFSFLKDIVHNHKFHSVDDDSIVVPVKVADAEDFSWKDETAKNLHRTIISSIRNSPTQIELTNALGKLCYLRTFLSLAKTVFCNNLLESLDNLEKTIETRLRQKDYAVGAWDFLKGTWITIFIACVATVITMFQLLQIPCIEGLNATEDCVIKFKIPGNVLGLTEGLLSNWGYFILGFFMLLCFIGYLSSRRSILELYSQRTGSEKWDWHLMRFFFGLALTNGKYIAVFWLTIFALVVLGLLLVLIITLIR